MPQRSAQTVCIRALRFPGAWLAVLAVVLLAVGTALTAPVIVASHARAEPFAVDYLAFDAAGTFVREGHAGELYDVAAQRAAQSARAGDAAGHGVQYFEFLYPPVVAAAFAPLAALPVDRGYLLFALVVVAALAMSGRLLWRLTDELGLIERSVFVACALGSTATCMSVLVGQVTPLLVLAALGALVALRGSRPTAGGVLLGLLWVKPHFAVAALIVALLARQRRTAAAIAGVGAVFALGSLLIAGADGARGYVELTRSVAGDPAALGESMRAEQNLFGLVATLSGARGGAALVIAQALVGLAALGLVARAVPAAAYAGTDRLAFLFALGAMLVLVASPHVQYYDLAWLVFPALFAARRRSVARTEELRRSLTGLMALAALFVEIAAVLASVGVSVSAPVLVLLLVGLCEWPRLERLLSLDVDDPAAAASLRQAA
jgi:hypothetical protein